MPFDKHDETYRELQNRFRCLECDPSGVHFCWKQEFKGWKRPHHIQLDASMLNLWATSILNSNASTHYPPRIPEFDNIILEPLYKKNPQHASIANAYLQAFPQLAMGVGGFTRELHYLHGNNHWDSNEHGKRRVAYNDDNTPPSSPVKR